MGISGRRAFLKSTVAGAAAIATGVAAGVTGPGWRAARAAEATLTVSAPLVDRLSIRCVIDNHHDVFESTKAPSGVEIERFRLAIGPDKRERLLSEWGLSLYLETSTSGAEQRYLLDFGLNPDTLANNLALLKINPANLDGLILSHGHLDHFSGLSGFLDRYGSDLRSGLNLYVGGEGVFCPRFLALPGGKLEPWGTLDRRS